MSKTFIVYHSDLDGHASGAVLQAYLKEDNPEMLRMNYDDKFPWDKIKHTSIVYMADFSLQPWSDMERLSESCKRFVWIDHHKTAIDKYNEWSCRTGKEIQGFRVDGTAACRLCWQYCFRGSREPQAIYLAGKFDVWQWQDVEGAIEFQYGTKFYQTDPGTPEGKGFWGKIFRFEKTKYLEIIKQGKLLMEYKKLQNSGYMSDNCFETELDELKVIAVNKKGSSQQFDSVWDPKKHDAMLTFAWAKGMWTVSLYTDKESIDVSTIAKRHGGGGHVGAAGFSTSTLPFQLK